MKSIQKLNVFLKIAKEEILVGELARDKHDVYFKYNSSFLKLGYELSPFKLPLREGIFKAPQVPFEGLFGVFDDSLPDGWGRLLLDRRLIKKGINPHEFGVLDRLAMLGEGGSGALIYRPNTKEKFTTEQIDLDNIARESKQLLEGNSENVLDELYHLGGSSGGARPKILVGYNPSTDQLVPDRNHLPDGFEHWIIKFPSSNDLPDIANIEYAYYLMAKEVGIEMSECKLLKGRSGKPFFATKRFDREGENRFHLISAAGLLHDNFRRSSLDYGHLMDAAFILEKDVGAYAKVLRLAAFNVFASNRDDHSKNFSFIMDANGDWKFAPAYDLTFSTSSHGMHSTTIAGEGENPTQDNLLALAKEFCVKDASQLIEKVKSIVAGWKDYALKSGVSEETIRLMRDKIKC